MTTHQMQTSTTDEENTNFRFALGFLHTPNQSVGFDMVQTGDVITLTARNTHDPSAAGHEEVVATKGTQLFNLLHTLIDTVHADNPARYLIGLDRR